MNPATIIPITPARPEANLIRAILVKSQTDAELRDRILKNTGWQSETSITKIINGNAGLMLEHIPGVLMAAGLLVVESSYIDWLDYGMQIGASCKCARAGMGVCGK